MYSQPLICTHTTTKMRKVTVHNSVTPLFVCFNSIFTPLFHSYYYIFGVPLLRIIHIYHGVWFHQRLFLSLSRHNYVILAYYYVICVIMLSYYTHTTSRFVTNVLILTASGTSEPTPEPRHVPFFLSFYCFKKCQVLVDCVIICLFFHFLSCFTYFAIFLCITLFSLLFVLRLFFRSLQKNLLFLFCF